MKIEDVYNEISPEPLPENRKFIQCELGGNIKGDDDIDFQIPTVKYVFRK
jgi:hypothetical protein